MNEVDDHSLMRRLRDGDDRALSLIIECHKTGLFRFVHRYVRNTTDAADILEQTFVKLYQNRHSYRPRARFSTWLFTIAANLCKDHARKRRRRPGDFAGDYDVSETLESASGDVFSEATPSPAESAAQNEEHRILRKAIDSLPHDLKSALVLFSLEGHSQEETAHLLGCSPKAVESRVYRAKKFLKERMEGVLGR